jgi:RND family efflux transporter MFP subunit
VSQPSRGSYGLWWALCGLAVTCAFAGAAVYFTRGVPTAKAQDPPADRRADVPRVEVVVPAKGQLDRTTTQPGSVRAFESVQLYAEASGYLKTLNVDIGDRVSKGQVLAEVAVPDLEKQVKQYEATIKQARSRVEQMEAAIKSAKADLEAARAAVPQAEALARSKAHTLEFRQKQLKRYRDLLALQSVDEKLVDEAIEQRDAAREAEIAAREGVNSAKAQVAANDARVTKAEADRDAARAEIDVAQALLEKAQVQVGFATLRAPFDGVVSERNYYQNDFIRSANESGQHLPLLTVQRTDLFRVVVQVPDRDVPFAKKDNPATVEIDALPGEQFPARVARVSRSEDPQTRLMHVEIDLPNKDDKIADGMYGQVTITLEKSNLLALPPSCLVGKVQDGKSSVFVVRDGRARLVPVRVGADNGVRVGIISGLRADDRVILHPGNELEDGSEVAVAE